MDALAEELEERMEAAVEELGTTQDEARRKELEIEIQASGRELGRLGAIIGESLAQAQLGSRLSAITVPFAQIAAQTAAQQAEIAMVIASHMTTFYSEDRTPTEEELAALRAEMDRLHVEMVPRREEIVRLQEGIA